MSLTKLDWYTVYADSSECFPHFLTGATRSQL